jgi:hypothetical protein
MVRRFMRHALITERVDMVDVMRTKRPVGGQKASPGRPASLHRTMISG